MNKRTFNIFFVAFLLVFFDQLTKVLFKGFNLFGIHHSGLGYYDSIPVIGTFLEFVLVENAGMAFGIEFGTYQFLLSIFSIIASILIGILLPKLSKHSLAVQIGFMLIFAGAIGNLIDRVFYGIFYGYGPLFYGKVVDFIKVDIPDITLFGQTWEHFPVFNIADSCVTCGVILLILVHKKIPELSELFIKKKNIPESS